MQFAEAMNRIKEIRQTDSLLIWEARDKFLSEVGYSTWGQFVKDNPDCAHDNIGPSDRSSSGC